MTHNTREWEKEFDEQFKGAIQLKNKPDGVTVTRLKHFIHQELQKAREEERERIRKVVNDLLPVMWNDDIEKHASNIRLTNNLHIILKALDQSELDQPTV